MAITTIGTLKTALTQYSKRTELSSADLGSMVGLFEARLQGGFQLSDGRFVKVRTAAMEAVPLTGNVVAGLATLALQPGYLETRVFAVQIGGVWRELEFETIEQVPGQFVVNGPPLRYTIQNGNWVMIPPPDIAYPYSITYYTSIGALADSPDSQSTSTNIILQKFPHLYLFGTLCEIAMYSRDFDKLEGYQMRFEQAVDECSRADRSARFSKPPRMDFSPDLVGGYWGGINTGPFF